MTLTVEIAERGTILRCLVGSQAHGLNVPGQDDRDEMGVCVEPPAYVFGLSKFEQHVTRSQPEGVRSQPGDLDLVVYGLRKWARLAVQGNPSVLVLLFAETLHCSWGGGLLRDHAYAFASREAGKRFLGYLTAQKQRLLGERGQMNVKRPDLIGKHGYDTKYAMHMLRLGVQGVEYMETGRLALPMVGETRDRIFAVRQGEWELNDVLTWVGELEAELEDLIDHGPLPERPDIDLVNGLLQQLYQSEWGLREMR